MRAPTPPRQLGWSLMQDVSDVSGFLHLAALPPSALRGGGRAKPSGPASASDCASSRRRCDATSEVDGYVRKVLSDAAQRSFAAQRLEERMRVIQAEGHLKLLGRPRSFTSSSRSSRGSSWRRASS